MSVQGSLLQTGRTHSTCCPTASHLLPPALNHLSYCSGRSQKAQRCGSRDRLFDFSRSTHSFHILVQLPLARIHLQRPSMEMGFQEHPVHLWPTCLGDSNLLPTADAHSSPSNTASPHTHTHRGQQQVKHMPSVLCRPFYQKWHLAGLPSEFECEEDTL